MDPIYVTKAAGLGLLTAAIYLMLAVDAVVVAGLLIAGVPAWISVLFLTSFLPAAIIWLVLPRRFELWPDRLDIVFPVLWRWSLPLDTIDAVEPSRWWHKYAFAGVRLASSHKQSVTIMRRSPNMLRRPNIVISPQDRDEFMRRINALLSRREANGA